MIKILRYQADVFFWLASLTIDIDNFTETSDRFVSVSVIFRVTLHIVVSGLREHSGRP